MVSYIWDFGDGTAPITVGVPTISHTYLWGATFDVTLTVKDDRGLWPPVTPPQPSRK